MTKEQATALENQIGRYLATLAGDDFDGSERFYRDHAAEIIATVEMETRHGHALDHLRHSAPHSHQVTA